MREDRESVGRGRSFPLPYLIPRRTASTKPHNASDCGASGWVRRMGRPVSPEAGDPRRRIEQPGPGNDATGHGLDQSVDAGAD